MRPKQKMNPFTDMNVFGRRAAEHDVFLLQQQRLRRTNIPETEWIFKYPRPDKIVFPDGEIAVSANAPAQEGLFTNSGSHDEFFENANPRVEEQNLKKKLSFSVRAKTNAKTKQVREINLLPKAYQQSDGRPAARFSAKTLPSLAVFLSLCILTLSLFPLSQILERKKLSAGQVLGEATNAYAELEEAKSALSLSDFEAADSSLSEAYRGFSSALESFQNLGGIAGSVPSAAQGKKLLIVAQQTTLALQYAVSGIRDLMGMRLSPGGISSSEAGDLRGRLSGTLHSFEIALKYLDDSRRQLNEIDITELPQDLRPRVEEAGKLLAELVPGLGEFRSLEQLLLGFVAPEEKIYLLLFQNNRELRATGGFIGTYGLLKMKNGLISDLRIESVYNPDGQLKTAVAAPGPLRRYLVQFWSLRDSNWFFNFPDSAKKAAEFFELETGVRPDEVLAFTPEIFVELLKIVGAVPMPEYGENLTAENFVDTTQHQTSVVYDRRLNQPKKFLDDFAPKLLARISELPSDRWLEVLQAISRSLVRKDLILFSSDVSRQADYSRLNWSGEVRDAGGDYLAVVNSSVGAGKTDQDITQEITLEAKIPPSGKQVNTLTIKRVHGESAEKAFPTNKNFLRIYVPLGSKFISANGFDESSFLSSSLPGAPSDPGLEALDDNAVFYSGSHVTENREAGKTVFAGWLATDPQTEKTVTLVYEVASAYNVSDGNLQAYSLLVQKQPGAPPTRLTSGVMLPSGKSAVWADSASAVAGDGRYEYKSVLESDVSWGLIF